MQTSDVIPALIAVAERHAAADRARATSRATARSYRRVERALLRSSRETGDLELVRLADEAAALALSSRSSRGRGRPRQDDQREALGILVKATVAIVGRPPTPRSIAHRLAAGRLIANAIGARPDLKPVLSKFLTNSAWRCAVERSNCVRKIGAANIDFTRTASEQSGASTAKRQA